MTFTSASKSSVIKGQRNTKISLVLISSTGHRGRQTFSRSDISSCGDSQIDRQGTPEPSPSASRVSRGHTGPQRQVQTVWKWIDITSGGNYTPIDIPFRGQSGLRCDLQDDAKPIDFSIFNLYFRCCNTTNL